jgi:beta-galactosidase
VYPNPNNGLFSIDFGKTYDRVNVEVYDAAGKQILVKEYNQVEKAQLSIDEPAGVYYIHLIIGEGKHVLPFIKQ